MSQYPKVSDAVGWEARAALDSPQLLRRFRSGSAPRRVQLEPLDAEPSPRRGRSVSDGIALHHIHSGSMCQAHFITCLLLRKQYAHICAGITETSIIQCSSTEPRLARITV